MIVVMTVIYGQLIEATTIHSSEDNKGACL